jgi:hypothetical protein
MKGDLLTEGSTILKFIFEKQDIGVWTVDWIEVAEDSVQWHAFVNTVMNVQIP